MVKKKKVVKLLQYLDTGIFPATVMFVMNMKYKELTVALKKNKLAAEQWLTGLRNDEALINDASWKALRRDIHNTVTKKELTLFYIIIPRAFDFSDYDYAKLAHEVLHICQFMLPDFLDTNKEHEAEAYLHTHLMMQCMKHIRGK